jgi:hypothetical protein
MEKTTRITKARGTVKRTRYAIGAAAVATFLGLGFASRAAHPGSAGTGSSAATGGTQPSVSSSTSSSQSDDSFFGGDDGGAGTTIAPSQSFAPSVQSGGS